jgi:hypothetical protein
MTKGNSLRSFAVSFEKSSETCTTLYDPEHQIEIDESVNTTVQETLSIRPAATTRKYQTYQKEFIEWCHTKGYRDGETVTGGKLHLFLKNEVVGRLSKKNKTKIIGGSTVCGCVSAIVDLYNQQVSMKMNSNPHPRSNAVKLLIKNVQSQNTNLRKRNYEDRGIGSLLDGYQSSEQFAQISQCFFTENESSVEHTM